MEGRLHTYHPTRNLALFEYTFLSGQQSIDASYKTPQNVLLFVGGLFDNFTTPSYVKDLAKLFPYSPDQKWAVMHVQLSSAMKAWGISDLNRDIEEISIAVKYIRDTLCSKENKSANVVLMGHSTGCQDLLHYLYSPPGRSGARAPVQGAILQAPVSDREAALDAIADNEHSKGVYEKSLAIIKQTPEQDYRTTILPMSLTTPLFGPAPISAARFLSLTSPDSPENPSMDDLFSSDLPDSRHNATFGKIGSSGLLKPSQSTPALLMLISDADEFMASHIDKQRQLDRWTQALASDTSNPVLMHPASKRIANATHDVCGEELDAKSRKARLGDLREAVLKYLDTIVGDIDQKTWNIWRDGIQDSTSRSMADLKL